MRIQFIPLLIICFGWLIDVIYNGYETKYIFLGAHYNFIPYASYENYYIENTGVYVEI